MSVNSPHESVKDIAVDVWKHNRAFAIALLVVVAAAIFWLWQKRQAATMTAPTASAPQSPIGPGGTFMTTYETVTMTTPPQIPPPISIPPIPTPKPPVPGPPGRPTWLPMIPNGARVIQGWNGLPYGWQAPGSKVINGLNPPPGTRIWQGSQGRWWYAVPGGAQQLLTTS